MFCNSPFLTLAGTTMMMERGSRFRNIGLLKWNVSRKTFLKRHLLGLLRRRGSLIQDIEEMVKRKEKIKTKGSVLSCITESSWDSFYFFFSWAIFFLILLTCVGMGPVLVLFIYFLFLQSVDFWIVTQTSLTDSIKNKAISFLPVHKLSFYVSL